MAQADFSSDGRRLLTSGDSDPTMLWDLSPDDRPTDDLLRLVQLLTGQRLDEGGNLTAVLQADARRAWDLLRPKYPTDFALPSAEDLRTWHQRQVDDAEDQEDWFAAKWHLERLLLTDPRQESLVRRRDKANAKLLWLEKEREPKKPADRPKG
jgi:hypothetical protein